MNGDWYLQCILYVSCFIIIYRFSECILSSWSAVTGHFSQQSYVSRSMGTVEAGIYIQVNIDVSTFRGTDRLTMIISTVTEILYVTIQVSF